VTYHVTEFGDALHNMRPGDVLAFGGNGTVSGVVKLVTKSVVSHVGVVLSQDKMIDSTSINGQCGVVVSQLASRIPTYDGDVWWLPLSDRLHETMNKTAFFDFLMKQDHKKYDVLGAVEAGLCSLGVCIDIEDKSKFFCSELVTAGLEAAGVNINERPAYVSPAQLCGLNIYSGNYHQLRGTSKMIETYKN